MNLSAESLKDLNREKDKVHKGLETCGVVKLSDRTSYASLTLKATVNLNI